MSERHGDQIYHDTNCDGVKDAGEAFIDNVNVSNVAYAAAWNGETAVAPSKNAVYDKIEAQHPGPLTLTTTPYAMVAADCHRSTPIWMATGSAKVDLLIDPRMAGRAVRCVFS